ncbi:MAG: hypothetical protein KGZ60_12270 [Truepera sp.]|nr:hypothetical protein [Truepera sp.]MBS3968023.1 hypothetical protein [Truepera sp.]
MVLVMLLSGLAQAQLKASPNHCERWSEPVTVGLLDTALLPEASGLAVSRLVEGRLYHINDSDDGPYLYLTDTSGGATRQVRIERFTPSDTEALAIGPCDDGQPCLFVGDIGDNNAVRDEIRLVVLRERDIVADRVVPYRQLRLRYPDGPRDAEALAVDPAGNIYLLSKEGNPWRLRAEPARLYRLAAGWKTSTDAVQTLEFLGVVDLPALGRGRSSLLGWLATGMDLSPDGERLLVLTYEHALEFIFAAALKPVDELVEGIDYRPIPLRRLPQQEAIAYSLDGRSFYYSTELRIPFSTAELVRLDCH